MLLSQTMAELGNPRLEVKGVYYDEVQINGAKRKAHVEALIERSRAVVVIAAKFSFRPHTSHPSYNEIVATVQGDLVEELPK